MEITFRKDGIIFNRELSSLDKLAISFASKLNKLRIKYVIVAGYVAIVFGRSRTSEDIDIIIEPLDYVRFEKLFRLLSNTFECHQAPNAKLGFEYLTSATALRFSPAEMYVPNIELKFAKTEIDAFSIAHRIKVSVNSNKLFIAPLEPQICYKLYMGSEKDVEDALYLYDLFKKRLNESHLRNFAKRLGVEKELQRMKWYV
ncbi:MAG: hypothetical protein Q7T16_04855 [Candidatus Burarchaeum sp.]|nr:hypothetical protein [Candidatus Burarchaeum sp.]MDO8339959.1 hypothetical protein [Candidatus Burarchaeum sp.]